MLPLSTAPTAGLPVALDESRLSYYDAENRLRAVDRRRCVGRAPEPVAMTQVVCVGWEPAPGRDPSVLEEYRYDALGRRIAVRTRPDAGQCSPIRPEPCYARVTRTVWDGDQLLLELRATGFCAGKHTSVSVDPENLSVWVNVGGSLGGKPVSGTVDLLSRPDESLTDLADENLTIESG